MKYIVLITLTILFSCKGDIKKEPEGVLIPTDSTVGILQTVFDSLSLQGSVLIFDPQRQIYFSNDFDRSDNGYLPASTFKIPNSIIALETGVVDSDTSVLVWNGEKRIRPEWEQDLTLRDAFHVSCVPCYQEVARKIGMEHMRNYLDQFDYGKMQFDSTTIDGFWLEGDSKISQREQIKFLQKFYNSELGISKSTEVLMKRLMVIDSTNAFKISGKTGWAIRNNNNIGWYVGYLETNGEIYFFATNVEPEEAFNMDLFPKFRKDITMKVFELLSLIPAN